jgi:hypothetical protein
MLGDVALAFLGREYAPDAARTARYRAGRERQERLYRKLHAG